MAFIPDSAVIGTCQQLCPAKEQRQRLEAHYTSSCEDVSLVKRYCRPAAGIEVLAEEVRPLDVLTEAVEYLLGHTLRRTDIPFHKSYSFVADRLRAVRQDIMVQHLSGSAVVCLLSRMLRYHCLAAYMFCDVFTPEEHDVKQASVLTAAKAEAGYDAVLNDSSIADIVSLSKTALRHCGGGSVAVLDVVDMYRQEVFAIGTCMSLLDGIELHSILRMSTRWWRLHLQRDARAADAAVTSLALELATTWSAGNWFRVIRVITSLCNTSESGCDSVASPSGHARMALRAVSHRLLPHARLHLLSDLADAIPARCVVSCATLARMLGFTTSTSRSWFMTLRFVLQLRQQVKLAAHVLTSGDGAVHVMLAAAGISADADTVTPRQLMVLQKAIAEDGEDGPLREHESLLYDLFVVSFNKEANFDAGSVGRDSRLLVALSPAREDSLCGFAVDPTSLAAWCANC